MSKWHYVDAASSQTGLMKCNCCNRPIDSGEYRYREGSDGYVTQHKHCSSLDPEWRKRRDADAKRVNGYRARLSAFEQFRKQWGAAQLDDEINDLRADISAWELREGKQC